MEKDLRARKEDLTGAATGGCMILIITLDKFYPFMMYYPLCCIQGYHVLLARHTTRDIIITEPQESEHLAASKYQNVLDIYIYICLHFLTILRLPLHLLSYDLPSKLSIQDDRKNLSIWLC